MWQGSASHSLCHGVRCCISRSGDGTGEAQDYDDNRRKVPHGSYLNHPLLVKFGVRWQAEHDTAFNSSRLQNQSAVVASLCRRTPKNKASSFRDRFAYCLIKTVGLNARCLALIWQRQHPNRQDVIAPAQHQFVAGLYGTGRLSSLSVKQNQTCLTQLLGNSATRANTTRFQE